MSADEIEEIPEVFSPVPEPDTIKKPSLNSKLPAIAPRRGRQTSLQKQWTTEDSVQKEDAGSQESGSGQPPIEMTSSKSRRASWMVEPTSEEADVIEESVLKHAVQREESDAEADTPGVNQYRRSSSGGTSMSVSGLEAFGRAASGSLAASMDLRNRLRSKAKSIVEKSRIDQRLTKRLSRRVSIATRITEDVDDERKVEEALAQSQMLRPRTDKQIGAARTRANKLPSAQQKYDFFTKVFSKTKEPARGLAAEGTDVEADDVITKKSVKALAPPYFQQLRTEANLYFSPASLGPVPLSKKVTGSIRRQSDDGIFTGPPLALTNTNKDIWEQRYVHAQDSGRGWFDEAGRLRTAAVGIAPFAVRPELDQRDDLMQFTKAFVGRRMTVGSNYELDVDLSKIVFTHHPLFSKEHVVANRVVNQYRVYKWRHEANDAQRYNNQLKALKIAVAKMTELTDHSEHESKQLVAMKTRVRELRAGRNKELANDTAVLRELLNAWNLLELLRTQQSFAATPFRLTFKKQDLVVEVDRFEWEADLMEELVEHEDAFFENIKGTANEENANFNADQMWSHIVQNAVATRRKPGEPIYTPILDENYSLTPTEQCPTSEQARRTAVAACQVSVRLYFNDLEACVTDNRPLNGDDFTVTFGNIYTLVANEWPQSITMKIFEKSSGDEDGCVAVVGLPIPPANHMSTLGISSLEEVQFSGYITVPGLNAAVGSGLEVNLNIGNLPTFIPRTSGFVHCAATWARHGIETFDPLAKPQQKSIEQAEKFDLNTLKDLQQLYATSQFDPNDPVNSRLAAILRNVDLSSLKANAEAAPTDGAPQPRQADGYFRAEHPDLTLVSDEEFYSDVRFKMFELRRQNVPEFRWIKMAPAYAEDVDMELFAKYERRLQKEKEAEKINGLDSLRSAGHKFAKLLREQVRARFTKKTGGKTYDQVVSDFPLPAFFKDMSGMCDGPEKGRKLRPARHATGREQPKVSQNVKVLVNIQTGINLPIRATKADDQNDVEPFFEITFQGVSIATSVVVGRNPTWQQSIEFQFKPPNNDFSPESLKTCTDVLHMNLYDQVVTKLPRDDREGNNTVREQIEKRWLGSIQLPFSTLYYNGKIEGYLRIKVPQVFAGYRCDRAGKTHPYVKLLLALEPPPPLPEPPDVMFETIENEQSLKTVDHWLSDMHSRFPERRYLATVLDTHGRSVLVTRYLKPLQPPTDVTELQSEPKKAAKLACQIVTLIPFVADSVLFPGLCDIWSTTDEFLQMLCGDEEEHAVLLCCWLLDLGIEAYLVIGDGLPEGPRSAYVLARFGEGDMLLYNASDGHEYTITDSACPLERVGCVISPSNVWANVQHECHPTKVHFNLPVTKEWCPLFKEPQVLDSVQPASIAYTATDAASVQELRAHLEREIKHNFDQWRPHAIPHWNVRATKTLRDLLLELEMGTITNEQHEERLKWITDSHTMCGFPIRLAYETAESVLEAVKATNVHINYHPRVEFAIAVQIHAYPCNILALWVYIASLIPNK